MTPSNPHPARTQPNFVQFLWRAVPYVLIAIAAYLLFAPPAGGPKVGEPASDFDLPLLLAQGSNERSSEKGALSEGDRIQLDDWRGEPVLIEVFASWCASCRASSATFKEVAQARRKGTVHFLAVSLDDEPEAGRQAAREWGFECPVAHGDSRFVEDYGISVLPTVILVDAEGRVRHAANGSVGRSKLEKWLSNVGASRL